MFFSLKEKHIAHLSQYERLRIREGSQISYTRLRIREGSCKSQYERLRIKKAYCAFFSLKERHITHLSHKKRRTLRISLNMRDCVYERDLANLSQYERLRINKAICESFSFREKNIAPLSH